MAEKKDATAKSLALAEPKSKIKKPAVKSETVRLSIPSPEQLLEVGVHFGHLKRRWYPKMAPYIYTEKEGVHVFDLYKTRDQLSAPAKFLREVVAKGGRVLFV